MAKKPGEIERYNKNDFIVKDSGNRTEFPTGAVRDIDDTKPRYDLITPQSLKRVADLYRDGAKKYGEHNWEKGIPLSRCYASLLRHAYAWAIGKRDEDHMAAVVWNALAILHFEETGREDLKDMLAYDKE